MDSSGYHYYLSRLGALLIQLLPLHYRPGDSPLAISYPILDKAWGVFLPFTPHSLYSPQSLVCLVGMACS